MVLVLVLAAPDLAYADIASTDALLARFKTVSATWTGPLRGLALGSFGLLAGLDLAYHVGYRLILSKAEIADVGFMLVQRVVTLSFFTFLLTEFTNIAPIIITSLGYAARQAGGVGMNPSDIISAGVTIAGRIGEKFTILHPGDSLSLALMGIIVAGCFVWIAATMVYVLIESYFLIGGAQILMLFGGSSFTGDIPINVLRTILGVSLKLYALQLIAGVGTTFVDQWTAEIHVITFQSVLIDICQAFLLAVITSRVPQMFERMVSHVSSGGGADIIRTAAVMGAAATAMSRAAMAMSAAVAGNVAAVRAASNLSSAQLNAQSAQGTGPGSTSARVASMIGSTARNLGQAKIEDVSSGLSGRRSNMGTSPFRMAAAMNDKTRAIQGGINPSP